ncbi:cytochrome b, partial [Saccharomonospora xinjiangensis]
MVTARLADAVDRRFQAAKGLRPRANKVFPGHFSFLFGEIALYSFVVLLLSGVFLTFFFDPSMTKVSYDGAYELAEGVRMSRAFATTLDLSFEVRGGLLVRQVHHWAALVFVAAILVHLLRVFFTGAFRTPREANWLIGVFLLALAVAEGFAGYSLPDDLLSGTGLRIAAGMMMSIPVIGTWVHWLVFGSEFPGEIVLSRLFTLHVLVLPGLILALVAVHLASVWYQEHTQFPGRRRRERNVVGTRTIPAFALKSTGLAATVAAVLLLMGALLQINPVFDYGPYKPGAVSTFAQPDWYLLFVEGALRLFPAWDLVLWDTYRVPAPFWPAVVLPLVLFTVVALYPFVEGRLTKSTRRHHNLAQRPRDVPARTALGVMGIAFYVILLLMGIDDVISLVFQVSVDRIVWIGRVAVFVVPPLAYWLTYRWCLRLQSADRDVLTSGVRTGVVRPEGGGRHFVEVRQPLHGRTADGRAVRPRYRGNRLPTLPTHLRTRQQEQPPSASPPQPSPGSPPQPPPLPSPGS